MLEFDYQAYQMTGKDTFKYRRLFKALLILTNSYWFNTIMILMIILKQSPQNSEEQPKKLDRGKLDRIGTKIAKIVMVLV